MGVVVNCRSCSARTLSSARKTTSSWLQHRNSAMYRVPSPCRSRKRFLQRDFAKPLTSAENKVDKRNLIAAAIPKELETEDPEREIQVVFMSSAAFAAFTFDDASKSLKRMRDRVFFGSGEYLPTIGTLKISYGRLIQLLLQKRVKRVYLMGDGQIAIVEVPFETHASDYKSDVRYDKNDLSIMYVDQKAEWKMEKMRYYCELPGDLWEDGTFLKLMKRNQYHRTADNRMKYEWLLREHQCTSELVVMDPKDSYVFANSFITQFMPILVLFLLRGAVWLGEKLTSKRTRKDPLGELAEQYGRPRVLEFNVSESEIRNDTGVRFEDVAGIDRVKDDIIEVMKMMRKDERYVRIGAKPPKGIVLEGPPGTGKTYLAKAMAGEGGFPFYSCNGAEFVEMFSGIAAARVRNLFKMARERAPSIIFIDEVDAIGRKRGDTGDSGSSEREAGLMQLLVEMDGAYGEDSVLVLGATNRVGTLDPALTRPGRFEIVIHMGLPTLDNRLKILTVHAQNKPIGESEEEKKQILERTSTMTIGYSGADLANLLNEAAILSVREANIEDPDSTTAQISMYNIREAIDKIKFGLPQDPLPDSYAKRFITTILAARAVILCTVPGFLEVDMMTLRPIGGTIGRIHFKNRAYGAYGDEWHQLRFPGYEVNAVKLDRAQNMLEASSALLMPLYVARAAEQIIYGENSITLSSATDLSLAGDLAHYLVAESHVHPAYRHILIRMMMRLGRHPDPTVKQNSHWFERYTSHMQEVAYIRARRAVERYRPAIDELAKRLIENEDEILPGSTLLEIINSAPLAEPTTPEPSFSFEEIYKSIEGEPEIESAIDNMGSVGNMSFLTSYAGEVTFERPLYLNDENLEISEETARKAAEVVIGSTEVFTLLTPDIAKAKVKQVREAYRKRSIRQRLAAVRRYWLHPDADMPPPPFMDASKPGPKVIYDTMRQNVTDPVEMVDDLDFWLNRKSRE